MRTLNITLVLVCLIQPAFAQENNSEGPSSEKARKSYKEAMEYLHHRMHQAALDSFRKADKQDGGQCLGCQRQIIKYGLQLHDWKSAEAAAGEMIAEAKEKRVEAIAHYQLGMVLLEEGVVRRHDDSLNRAHEALGKALAIAPKFPLALFADGRVLASEA